MSKTIDIIREMQTRTLKVPAFCQAALAEAGVQGKSVKTLSQLVAKLGEHRAIEVSRQVFEKKSRAHNYFRGT